MTKENPYASPAADPDEGAPAAPSHFGDAGNGQRFLNLLIDYAGFIILSLVIGVVLGVVGAIDLLNDPIVERLFGIGLMLFYYTLFEGLTGRTPGKLITGTKVIGPDGRRPGFLRVLGRSASRFIPFEPFSFFGTQPGGWHDRISKTRVVRLRPNKFQQVE